jgi:hypothetical protein
MIARPLDQILPARVTTSWILARGWALPRFRWFFEAVWTIWCAAAPWIAGLAFALAYLLVCAWLDKRDAIASFATAQRAGEQLQQENAELRARVAELQVMSGSKTLFYLIESGSLEQAAAKLQRVAMTIAGDAYNMQPVIPREKK